MKKLGITFIIFYLSLSYSLAENQIVITGTQHKEVYEDIVKFFADYWRIDSVNFVVVFQNFPQHGHRGYVDYQEVSEYNLKNVIIKLDANLKYQELRTTLIHELIHVKQFFYKELIKLSPIHFVWKGQDFLNINKVDYKKLPWEKEALSNEKKLYLMYLSYQKKGKVLASR